MGAAADVAAVHDRRAGWDVAEQPDMTMIAQASSGREAIQLFREHRPDVTLMDLRMPDISGIDALIAILTEFRCRNARLSKEASSPWRLRRCGPLVQDHPVDAESIPQLAEAGREKRLLHRHEHFTAIRERRVDALRLGVAVDE